MRSVIFKPAHEQRMLCSPVLSLCRELAMLIGRCFRPIKQAKARSPILEGPENFSHPDELKMVLRARKVSRAFEKQAPGSLANFELSACPHTPEKFETNVFRSHYSEGI